MLLKAREEGFREAMDIFSSNVITKSSYNGIKETTDEGPKRRRRDIRQMIIKELSYSAKAMTTRQIAKAIDYLPDPTETTLKRLQNEGKTVQKWRGSLGGCCYKRCLAGSALRSGLITNIVTWSSEGGFGDEQPARPGSSGHYS